MVQTRKIKAISFDGDMTLWDFEELMRRSLGLTLVELRRRVPGEATHSLYSTTKVDWVDEVDPRRAALVARRCTSVEELANWIRAVHQGHERRPSTSSIQSSKSTYLETATNAALVLRPDGTTPQTTLQPCLPGALRLPCDEHGGRLTEEFL